MSLSQIQFTPRTSSMALPKPVEQPKIHWLQEAKQRVVNTLHNGFPPLFNYLASLLVLLAYLGVVVIGLSVQR